MRQIVTTGTGDIDVLKVEAKPDPSPGDGEVLIRVRAAGLNFADILSRQGLYPDSPPKPCVMGYEVSGVVEALGKNVNTSLQDKSVVALTRFGGQSELVTVDLRTSGCDSRELLDGLCVAGGDGLAARR
jgi:synaptic vesicle membrane protein VAT-1